MRYAFQKGPMQAQTPQKVADRKIDHKMQTQAVERIKKTAPLCI